MSDVEAYGKAWGRACIAWSADNLDQIEETMRLGEVMMFAATDLIAALHERIEGEGRARLDLSLLAAEEAAKADTLRALLTRAREYVTDALEAYEHSDGRDLLREIDAALPDPQPQRGVA